MFRRPRNVPGPVVREMRADAEGSAMGDSGTAGNAAASAGGEMSTLSAAPSPSARGKVADPAGESCCWLRSMPNAERVDLRRFDADFVMRAPRDRSFGVPPIAVWSIARGTFSSVASCRMNADSTVRKRRTVASGWLLRDAWKSSTKSWSSAMRITTTWSSANTRSMCDGIASCRLSSPSSEYKKSSPSASMTTIRSTFCFRVLSRSTVRK
mmetsp:Transcript_10384/g.32179  ORF Transcript_10384/g.32179 Transcript_10384/m.32179 type:complete len:211 (-) Transcript_10384:131-763(-)